MKHSFSLHNGAFFSYLWGRTGAPQSGSHSRPSGYWCPLWFQSPKSQSMWWCFYNTSKMTRKCTLTIGKAFHCSYHPIGHVLWRFKKKKKKADTVGRNFSWTQHGQWKFLMRLNNSNYEWIHTCFIFQNDYARFIDAEHIVNNVLATHMGWV